MVMYMVYGWILFGFRKRISGFFEVESSTFIATQQADGIWFSKAEMIIPSTGLRWLEREQKNENTRAFEK